MTKAEVTRAITAERDALDAIAPAADTALVRFARHDLQHARRCVTSGQLDLALRFVASARRLRESAEVA